MTRKKSGLENKTKTVLGVSFNKGPCTEPGMIPAEEISARGKSPAGALKILRMQALARGVNRVYNLTRHTHSCDFTYSATIYGPKNDSNYSAAD